MKNLILILCLVAVGVQAQVNRFIYEYRYAPDTLKIDSLKTELMILDIDKKGSYYMSISKMKMDSISYAIAQKVISGGEFNFPPNLKFPDLNYKIYKEYPGYKTYLYEPINADLYKISEDEKMIWKIFPDKSNIQGYTVQKAITSFGARQWTAWFTQEIPFQEGPYKFYGLPGLIVKIEDATKTHSITLIANKKVIKDEPKEIKGYSRSEKRNPSY